MVQLFSTPVMRWVVLVTALLLWANVSGLATNSEQVTAPLHFTELKDGLAVANVITEVEARVSGKPHALARLSDDSFVFTVDLSSITQAGQYTRTVEALNVPAGVTLTSYKPSEIVFKVAPETSKTVPAIVKTTGQIADGYNLENLTVAPDQVTIYGASQVLDSISSVQAYVDINQRRSTFLSPSRFVAENGQGRVIQTIRTDPAEGTVTASIKEGAAFRSLGLRPTFQGELPGGFWVKEVIFSPSVVTVRGDYSELQELTSLSTTAIQLSDQTDSFHDQVAVNTPNGVEVVGDNLVHVQVIVASTQDSRQLTIIPKFKNVADGFGVTTIAPASVKVVLTGDPAVLDGISRNDVVLNLDLLGALSGSNVVDLTTSMFETVAGVEVISFEPDQVEVVLSRAE